MNWEGTSLSMTDINKFFHTAHAWLMSDAEETPDQSRLDSSALIFSKSARSYIQTRRGRERGLVQEARRERVDSKVA